MKSPAFQFYASDFLVGVMGMSDDEIGVYIKMLAFQWVKGGLPADPKTIRIAINSRKNPSENVLKKFTVSEDGLLRNERLEQERQKQATFRESRADNAKKGWAKKRTSNARASMSICIAACENDALQSSVFNLQSSDYSPPTPSAPAAEGESVAVEGPFGGRMFELMAKVNATRPEWKRTPHFSRDEMETLMSSAKLIDSWSDDDWQLLREFLAYKPRGAEQIRQVQIRSFFLKDPASAMTNALLWAESHGRPKPKQPLPEGYK